MKIYTKSGDKGTTSLIGGERVPKFDARVVAYGTVDELSAHTAMLRDMLAGTPASEFKDDLTDILGTLMSVEAVLALGKGGEGKIADVPAEKTGTLEGRIDAIDKTLQPAGYFTIPGGHVVVSQTHICRTVCRRAEREACRAASVYDIMPGAMAYLNRLSDYFYTLGRKLSEVLGIEETLWKP